MRKGEDVYDRRFVPGWRQVSFPGEAVGIGVCEGKGMMVRGYRE